MIAHSEGASIELQAGLGEMVHAGHGRLSIHGLGSCIALSFWCREPRVGLLCHIVLPASAAGLHGGEPARFADLAVPGALHVLRRQYGIPPSRVSVKMTGGATLFGGTVGALAIGPRNVDAVNDALRAVGLASLAADTGGRLGRSVLLDVATGDLHVRRFGAEVVVL